MLLRFFALCVVLVAVLLAACATPGTGPSRDEGDRSRSDVGAEAMQCDDCGVVEGIERVYVGKSERADDVLGGVVGQAIASESTNSAPAATSGRATPMYQVSVRMSDGRRLVLRQRDLGGIRAGASVKVRDGRAHLQ